MGTRYRFRKKFLVSWVSEWWIFMSSSLILLPLIYPILVPVFTKGHEYGSNLDPDTDPQRSCNWIQLGSRSGSPTLIHIPTYSARQQNKKHVDLPETIGRPSGGSQLRQISPATVVPPRAPPPRTATRLFFTFTGRRPSGRCPRLPFSSVRSPPGRMPSLKMTDLFSEPRGRVLKPSFLRLDTGNNFFRGTEINSAPDVLNIQVSLGY